MAALAVAGIPTDPMTSSTTTSVGGGGNADRDCEEQQKPFHFYIASTGLNWPGKIWQHCSKLPSLKTRNVKPQQG
jgi:hypothetical protein